MNIFFSYKALTNTNIPVQTRGNYAGNESKCIADSLPCERTHALERDRERELSLECIDIHAKHEVHSSDKKLRTTL